MKDAADIIIYEHMIWDIKPKSIIEIGTAQGGYAHKFSVDFHTPLKLFLFWEN